MIDETQKKAKPASSWMEKSKPIEKKIYFSIVNWKGVKEVFKCEQCKECRDHKDEMIEHILLHYKSSEQEVMLDILLKE